MEKVFNAIEIDFKKTRRNVYKLFDRYRYLLNLLPLEITPNLTQQLSFTPPSTKQSLNNIESIVEKELQREAIENEFHDIVDSLDTCMKYLNPEERVIIYKRYLQTDTDTDYQIYTDLHLGKTKYYQKKKHAVNKIGVKLDLEVYKKKNANFS